jgi:hypothetical protein
VVHLQLKFTFSFETGGLLPVQQPSLQDILELTAAVQHSVHENARFDDLVDDAIRLEVDFQKFPNIDPVEPRRDMASGWQFAQ